MLPNDLLASVARIGLVVLLYSLWQGALIALVTWGALQIFKSVNAATRYAVWTLALLAIIIVPVVTTLSRVHVSSPQTNPHIAVSSTRDAFQPAKPLQKIVKPSVVSDPVAAPATPWYENLVAQLPKAYAFCVGLPTTMFAIGFGLWFFAAFVILMRLVVAFVQLERLKHDSLPLSVEFRDSMPRWMAAMKGERDVRICVSEKIEVPIAVGLFDSMVLLPSHLVHSLDAEEIDQISLHELCHLLRADDWTNALQRVAAALLFFNPAMWFISRQMDVEREVACDDYVLQLTGAVRPYALCLTKMAEMTAWPHRALPAPGVFVTRKNISIRIERLLRTGRAISSSIAPNVAAVVVVALVAVFLVLRTMTPSIAFTLPEPAIAPVPPIASVVSPKPKPAKLAVPKVTAVQPVAPHPMASIDVQKMVQEQVKVELHTNAAHLRDVKDVANLNARVDGMIKSPSTIAAITNSATARSMVASADGCTGCNFADANLSGRDFSNHSMEGSNFAGANLQGAHFDHAQLTGSNFSGADLRNASFAHANLEGCNMRHAQLAGANFEGAQLTGCSIDVRDLTPEQTRTILNACEGCDFAHANLHGMDLHGVHLTGADLAGADLSGANLQDAMFTGVNFANANLHGANVNGADFTGCNFSHVDLRGVDLSHASLTGSDMAHAIWQ